MFGYRKHALTGVARSTFRFMLGNWRSYAVFLSIAFILYLIPDLIFVEGDLIASVENPEIFESVLLAYYVVFTAITAAIVAVPLHNFIIKGTSSFHSPYFGRIAIFFLLEALLSGAVIVGVYLVQTSILQSTWLAIGGAFLFAVSTYLGVIMITVFPAIAVTPTKEFNFGSAISISRGVRGAIVVRVIRLCILAAIMLIAGNYLAEISSLTFSEDEGFVGIYGSLVTDNITYSIQLLIIITFASHIYLRLNGDTKPADVESVSQ